VRTYREVKVLGDDVVSSGGVDAFPVTVTNPGSDASAYFSAPVWITKDPETGVYNAGTYRVMVKAADRLGISMLSGQDGRAHWEKARALGQFEGFHMAELRPKVPNLKKVTYFEMGGSAQSLAITLHEPGPGEAWEALRAAASARNMPMNKWIIAVDDDIDAEDLESVLWALSWRVQPHRDIQIQRGRVPWHGYQLGYLPDDWNEAAQRAVRGDYLKTGEEFRQHRTESSYFETGVVVPREEDRSPEEDRS
jgi:3-polyprenyl-4-hydroxybenzoate decarboxylase